MASLNKVFLAGNLTRDPELRYTPGGSAVADLNLAVSRTYLTKSSEQREEVCFVRIVVWGKQAQSSAQYLSKGSPVLVEGRLQYDTWESKDGEKRSQIKVQAERVQFLGRPKGAEGGAMPASAQGGYVDSYAPDISPAPVEPDMEDDIPF